MKIILVFGGNQKRLDQGILCYKQLKASIGGPIKLIVSAMKKSFVIDKVTQEGIPMEDLICVYSGLDTLTELTSTKSLIKNRFRAKELYLVSDHWHLPRIRAIANIVYFLSGIKLKSIPYFKEEDTRSESRAMINIDRIRALLWRFTGLAPLGDNVKTRLEYITKLEFQ